MANLERPARNEGKVFLWSSSSDGTRDEELWPPENPILTDTVRILLLIAFLFAGDPTSVKSAESRAPGAPEVKEARLELKRSLRDQALVRAERTAHMLADFEDLAPRRDAKTVGGRP